MKILAISVAACSVEGAVQRDNAAEGRGGVGAEGLAVGVGEAGADRHAARVGVLDDGDRRRFPGIELGDHFVGGVGVVEVVVRQLLALDLAGAGDAGARRTAEVEPGGLVRVLAVAERLGELAADRVPGGVAGIPGGEPTGDGGVVGGGTGEGLGGQPAAERQRGRAAIAGERGGDLGVIGGVDHDGDVAVVLGGGADHRRAADVDGLDHGALIGAGGERGLERVEVDHQQVDALDPVLLHGGSMGGLVADAEQAAVDRRVQRLDAAVHDLREAGDGADVGDGEARCLQGTPGAAGRDQLDFGRCQRLGEFDQAGLVEHGEKGAADGDLVAQWH